MIWPSTKRPLGCHIRRTKGASQRLLAVAACPSPSLAVATTKRNTEKEIGKGKRSRFVVRMSSEGGCALSGRGTQRSSSADARRVTETTMRKRSAEKWGMSRLSPDSPDSPDSGFLPDFPSPDFPPLPDLSGSPQRTKGWGTPSRGNSMKTKASRSPRVSGYIQLCLIFGNFF